MFFAKKQKKNSVDKVKNKCFAMPEKKHTLQDLFLNQVRKDKAPVTVFLINGVKLQGVIVWFDAFSILLRRESHSQLVYKHAISTIMPAQSVFLPEEAAIDSERP